MARSPDNYNHSTMDFVFWLFISMAIVVILHILLPFPISFIVSIIAIFSLGIYRDDRALKKAGMGGIKGWYNPCSPPDLVLEQVQELTVRHTNR